MLVGALPGAGGPVASFIAYNEAKRIVKKPEVPFGEGAVEGIMASESSNNACIGGALIPMLTLAVPGDAVTAIICLCSMSMDCSRDLCLSGKSGSIPGDSDRRYHCLLCAAGTGTFGCSKDQ